ncbi:hypothetical protein N0K21_03880 [Yersinia aleksiciae]|uniref:hypothetical protein n=1 Tax=Yersinia aleksiciae TaxID=263819 RepID=UPI002E12466D|nr:hypothetical protein N0K21_03880 [Yersinia aleksiciae]
MQIDWFQVITDVERSGMTQQQIAKGIRVAKATLFGWKQGSNPRYDDGEALIRLWELVTDKNPTTCHIPTNPPVGSESVKLQK